MVVASGALRLCLLFASPMQDESAYEQLVIAKNAVSGHGFDMAWPYAPVDSNKIALFQADPTPYPSAFMPPFMPALFTVAYSVFGLGTVAVYAVLILQCLLGAFIPFYAYRIAIQFSTQSQALLASSVSLFYLPGLISSATPAGAVFYGLFGLVAIDLAMRVTDKRANAWLLGVALGLLTLMRSEFLLIGILIGCIPLLKRNWNVVLRTLFVMALVISPWLIRNAIEFQQPVGIITHPWREIWRGANVNASGSGYDADGWNIWEGVRFPQLVSRLDSIPFDRSFELKADKVFKDEAVTYIKHNPLHWSFLSLKKMAMLWTIDPYYPNGLHLAYILPTVMTSLLILTGFVISVRRHYPVLPLALVIVCLTGLFGITYVQPRYQTYLFTIALPLIACLPIPNFAQSFFKHSRETIAP